MTQAKSPFLDGELIPSASELDRMVPSSSALETPFLHTPAFATDQVPTEADEADSFSDEVQYEELGLLPD